MGACRALHPLPQCSPSPAGTACAARTAGGAPGRPVTAATPSPHAPQVVGLDFAERMLADARAKQRQHQQDVPAYRRPLLE